MTKNEILDLLYSGHKLIEYHGYRVYYYIKENSVGYRLTESQFLTYKKLCNKSDDSEKDRSWFRNQSYSLYYWIEK